MSKLSQTDSLRLQVLLASDPQAIRIDESRLTVHGLHESGETVTQLNPTADDGRYLKAVRELLSSKALGFPGGYPVFLRHWTRVSQVRETSIDPLLLLGEPEAFRAVLGAGQLSQKQAKCVWWALPEAETARRLLRHHTTACGDLTTELSAFLIDYLPFETEPESIIESIELMLITRSMSDAAKAGLWQKAQKQPSILIGFLVAGPIGFPETSLERTDYQHCTTVLSSLIECGNPHALMIERALSGTGQSFFSACRSALLKPANQQVVSRLLQSIAKYFRPVRPADQADADFATVEQFVEKTFSGVRESALEDVLLAAPELEATSKAMLKLSLLSDAITRPVLINSTSVGAQMRKKLAPVVNAIDRELALMLGE